MSDLDSFDFFSEFTNLSDEDREELNDLYKSHYELVAPDSAYILASRAASEITSYLFLSIFSAFIFGLAGIEGLAAITFVYTIFSIGYIFFPMQIRKTSGNLREITQDNSPEIYDAFQKACEEVEMTGVSLYAQKSSNSHNPVKAYPEQNAIVFQNELPKYITKDGFIAILIHELAHVRSRPNLHRTAVLFTNISPFLTAIIAYIVSRNIGISILVLLVTLFLYTAVARSIIRQTEVNADETIPEKYAVPFAKNSIRMLKGVEPHVESRLGRFVHALLDEHPPLNTRIERALSSGSASLTTPTFAITSKRQERFWRFSISAFFYTGIVLILLAFLSPVYEVVDYRIAVFGGLIAAITFPGRAYFGHFDARKERSVSSAILISVVASVTVLCSSFTLIRFTNNFFNLDLIGLVTISVIIVFAGGNKIIVSIIENYSGVELPSFGEKID